MNEQAQQQVAAQLQHLEAEVQQLQQTQQALAPGEAAVPAAQSAAHAGQVRVRFTAPAGIALPVEAVGRYWHDRGEYLLSAADADQLRDQPGFIVVAPDRRDNP